MYNPDSHFVIGKDHIRHNMPCQDHALSYTDKDSTLVVVSDGCSTGRHTDIGARIITCSTINAFKLFIDTIDKSPLVESLPSNMQTSIQSFAETSKNILGLKNQDLLATCVYAIMNKEGGLVHVLGDGAVIYKFRDGKIVIYLFEWELNTPYYPINKDIDLERFINFHSQINNGTRSLQIKKISLLSDGSVLKIEIEHIPLLSGITGYTLQISKNILEDLECLLISSDGINVFHESENGRYPLENIGKEITSFKNYNGDFIKRRMTRMLNDYSRIGILPTDDLAIAGINFSSL